MLTERNTEALTSAKEANSLLLAAAGAAVGGVVIAFVLASEGNLWAFVALLAGFAIGFILAVLWAFNIINVLNALVTQINGIIGDFNASINRKYELQQVITDLAERLSRTEANVQGHVVSELRQSAEAVAASPKPSLILANLAANFPDLNNFQGFLAAQRSALEIEEKIDRDVRAINGKGATYNEIRVTFPAAFLATVIFNEFEQVSSTTQLEKFKALRSSG